MAQIVLYDDTLPIRVTAAGAWLHGALPLHPRVRTLFARSVVPHPDGRYSLAVGRATHPLEVDDTAYHVRRIELVQRPQGALEAVHLHLSDGAEEPLDPATLMQGRDWVLYCQIVRHGLAVPCRFSAEHYHTLALHMDMEGAQGVLPLAGRPWPVHAYQARPIAAAPAARGRGTPQGGVLP